MKEAAGMTGSPRIGMARAVGVAAVAAVTALGGWAASTGTGLFPERWKSGPAMVAQAAPGRAPEATIIAQAMPVTARLSLVGTVEPARTVNVIAPFGGMVRDKRFAYGERVERGQTLFVMDSFDLDLRLRDAEAAMLKAAQRVGELADWSRGAEVSRARRQVAGTERDAAQAQRRLRDARPLIDQGIIPRQEYEDLRHQAEAQAAALATAREDLDALLRRGGADARRLADLDLASATARLADLQEQRGRATVAAPVSGLVLKPPATAQTGATAVETGSSVTGNQILLLIAELESVAVTARVDEMDVNRLRVGQPVTVTGDAFPGGPLHGRLAWVAHQATPAENGAPGASFALRVELPSLTEEQRAPVRIGMSAALSITLHDNPAGIVLPPEAVRRTTAGPTVLRRDPASGAEEEVPVTLGEATPAGVEIRNGLRAGDMVVVAPP